MGLLGVAEGKGWALGRRSGSRIRLLHGSTSSTTPAPLRPPDERRGAERLPPDQTKWADNARLRPGLDVRIVDIGPRGVLIESPVRLQVGARVELALFESDGPRRLDLTGVVRRCNVSSLSPLTYRGGLEFDRAIELTAIQPFLAAQAAMSA